MASGVIEARWSEREGAWNVRPPSWSWTRLHGTWPRDASERDLLVGVRRQFGHQATRGLALVKVERAGR